tara:strand:- start:133 stop:399 length:267 start_codon:yes stop_codon:yes gene_type:complete
MPKDDTIIEFPCDFPIKVIGNNNEKFLSHVVQLAKKYYPDISEKRIQNKASSNGNFISITLTVYAKDKPTLDKLYTKLSQLDDTKMVL